MITSDNYVEKVLRTDNVSNGEVAKRCASNERLVHASMGITTEAGEFVDSVKKRIFYGKPLDRTNAIEELGDILWYIAIAIDELNTSFSEVMTKNIEKLKLRYPEKFTEEKAINRNIEAERKTLEKANNYNINVSDLDSTQHDFTKLCLVLDEFPANNPISKRGEDWVKFSDKVLAHIEEYTVPQYGDKGVDQITEWTVEQCLKTVQKRISRYGRQSREGQQELDFLKMAHEVQIAFEKYKVKKELF